MKELFNVKNLTTIAVISGFFTVLISLLLIFNYIQLSNSKPLETKAMDVLIERLAENPDNEQLRDEIRNLDFLARKAYFNTTWQIKTGGIILLIIGIIFLVSFRFIFTLKEKIELPIQTNVSENLSALLSQRWVSIISVFLITIALIIGFLSNKSLTEYKMVSNNQHFKQVNAENSFDVIDITSDTTSEDTLKSVVNISENTKKSEIKFPSKNEIEKNHNSFRGSWGLGLSKHKNIPTDWDGATGINILWKAPMYKNGYNSPILWGNRLFLAGGDEKSRVVYCYDKNSGKLIWQKEASGIEGSPAKAPKTTDDTGLSAPSLTCDGTHVVALFGNGDIIAFSIDGERLWAKNLGVPDNHYGHSSSLISLNEKLFIQYDTNKGGKLKTLNITTGEQIWEKSRKSGISWASPIIIEHKGKKQIVLSSAPFVSAYDTESGTELWSNNCMMGEVGPSPAYGDGLVFACNEYAKLVAIDPSNGNTVWENNEYLPEVSSPVVSEGLLFVVTTYGMVVCYEAKSGEKLWEQDLAVSFYASPMIADKKLYVSDMNGTTHIFEAGREAKIIAQPKVDEKIVSTMAFSEGRIYLRGVNNLYCIGK